MSPQGVLSSIAVQALFRAAAAASGQAILRLHLSGAKRATNSAPDDCLGWLRETADFPQKMKFAATFPRTRACAGLYTLLGTGYWVPVSPSCPIPWGLLESSGQRELSRKIRPSKNSEVKIQRTWDLDETPWLPCDRHGLDWDYPV